MATLSRRSNLELLKMPDCGGLREDGRCSRIDIPCCTGPKCAFFREASSPAKARIRLRSLDEALQKRIADKYYGGKRPWTHPCEESTEAKGHV
ncbi:hypothetical protein [Papillibacter cinnamivorans]|uniref:Uncharacterized protein n=1 Tax=Papillibacter cinnamivorans DSM 12816 TaxID=1122930 RepID=A0A1W2CAX3_9FIRM|nr:hypothetical protein [Papillibacter cinnamivorans]SMC81828.1 hypothetical protein SAMN02745168_2642 [Papillibacter cinnamivorans DSM 12816]